MSDLFDLSNFDKYKEDNCREVKKAEGGLPIALWESYSSFANSNGGVIILGVGERQDGTWYTTGLKNADKLKRNFWNTIHDIKKVSINLLSDKNVESYEVNGDTILVIYVPRAKREQKPVYINNDLFGGCYRRDWEGDYHCSKAEIKGMLRDAADETEDMKIVEQFDISAIDTESLKAFRNHHKSYRPEHVFNNLPDDEYLERIGAAGFGEDGKLHPTTAGLPMPVVEESYNPDRTRLSLEFAKKQTIKTNEENKRRKQAKKTSEGNRRKKTEENYKMIRKYLRQNGLSKTNDIADAIGLSAARTRVLLKEMPDVEYEGTNTNRKYRLSDEN